MSKKKFLQKSFTLIELIIVMAILAILATGLLVALDPVEQVRRGSDSNVRDQAAEITKGIQRYYAANASSSTPYPWGATTGNVTATTISNMQLTGELKAGYTVPANLTIWGVSSTQGWVCFVINGTNNSKSIKLDPNSKYSSNQNGATACTGPGPTNSCGYWCLQP